jgi:hypothetical protein
MTEKERLHLSRYAARLSRVRSVPRGCIGVRSGARPLLELAQQNAVLLELGQRGPQGSLDFCHGALV